MIIELITIKIGFDKEGNIVSNTSIKNELLEELPDAKNIIVDAVGELTNNILKSFGAEFDCVSTTESQSETRLLKE